MRLASNLKTTHYADGTAAQNIVFYPSDQHDSVFYRINSILNGGDVSSDTNPSVCDLTPDGFLAWYYEQYGSYDHQIE